MGSGDYEARRAVSCLIEPCADDTVLLALGPSGGAWVLAVLEREEGARATVSVDGDLELRLRSGSFTVAAQEGIDLLSPKKVNMVAGSVAINADDCARRAATAVASWAGLVHAELDRVKLLAGTFDSVLERFSQRVKNSYRTVEETDQLHAERIDYTATSTMSLHAENAIVTAEQLVKVDGEQIHLG